MLVVNVSHAGDCLKEYEEEGGIGSCGKYKNCLLIKKSCFGPNTKYLRETHKIFGKKLISLHRKVYIHMIMFITSTVYLKHNYLQRKLFTLSSKMRIFLIKIMSMRKRFGKLLIVRL